MIKEMNGIVDSNNSIDGNGGDFANKANYLNSTVGPKSLASTASLPPVISLANFIGLADLVYSDTVLNEPSFSVNGTQYAVVASKNDQSNSYQGFVLYDQSTNSVFVVNRGTQEFGDKITDAEMAITGINNQWSDALALAKIAGSYASSHNNSTVYAVGHSLGGSLAELQAADFGWVGYTFNAYGASDVFNKLGLTLNSKANINNYRTMFDVVSDASTHLGNQPITLETAADVALLASGGSAC